MEFDKFIQILREECPTIFYRTLLITKLYKNTEEVLEEERIIQELKNLSKLFELRKDEFK